MPVGAFQIMKATLEGVETDTRSILALRYKTGIAMNNMTR